MDIEKARRKELRTALGEEFQCFEEVPLRHAMFPRRLVRADMVAIPVDERLAGYALAFEVKEPKEANYAAWSQHVRQASDYVYASMTDAAPAPEFAGRRIAGAFLFPTPHYDPEGSRYKEPSPFVAPGDEVMATGIFHLALHFRVGRAFWEPTRTGRRFSLAFGPNTVWESDRGFRIQGINLLAGKRTLGSQRIDVKTELDGWG